MMNTVSPMPQICKEKIINNDETSTTDKESIYLEWKNYQTLFTTPRKSHSSLLELASSREKEPISERIIIKEGVSPFEKGKEAFNKELPEFLSSGIEEHYAAYIDGICVGFGNDDAKLFLKTLKKYGKPPDFIGYIGEDGIEKVVHVGNL